MENITKLSLEYNKHVNNTTNHKRQIKRHSINKVGLESAYKSYLSFYLSTLTNLNDELDGMGFEDLTKYEEWLLDVHE